MEFCETGNPDCARYRVYSAMGIKKVPADMFPNDKDMADEMLQGSI